MRSLYGLFDSAKQYFSVGPKELISELMLRPNDLQFQAFFKDDVLPQVEKLVQSDPTIVRKLARLGAAASIVDEDERSAEIVMNSIGTDDRQAAIIRAYNQIGLPTQVAENYQEAIEGMSDGLYKELMSISNQMGRTGSDDVALQEKLESVSLKMSATDQLGQAIAKGISEGSIQTVKPPQHSW